MATLRVLLVLLIGALGFDHAEQTMVARSMSSLMPPFRPNVMRPAFVIPPPRPLLTLPLLTPPPPTPVEPGGPFP